MLSWLHVLHFTLFFTVLNKAYNIFDYLVLYAMIIYVCIRL